MKKSQLSIFVIIGLLLIIMLSVFLLSRSISTKREIESKSNEIKEFQSTKEALEDFSSGCLEVATEQALYRYGYDYVYEQVVYYTKKMFFNCVDGYSEFKAKDFDISYDEPELNLSIYEKKITSVLLINLTMEKNGEKTFFKSFDASFEKPVVNIDGEWIFRGILYKYEEATNPRPMQIYIAKVDLEDPTVSYYVTPRIAPNIMTTSQFLWSNELQLAINGGGFDDKEGTNEVNLYAAYKGVAYSDPNITPENTIFITNKNEILSLYSIPSNMEYAISGQNQIIENGKIFDRFYDPTHHGYDGYNAKNPATTIGKDENDNWVVIIVVDGRNLGISEGISMSEIGEMHLKYVSTFMMLMDGGGSTTLVRQEGSGYKILNNPSDGAERAVANHFGVYAEEMPIINTMPIIPSTFNVDTLPLTSDGSSILKYRIVSPGIGAGGQPSPEDYKWLASQGYKTVIDVQGDDNSAAVTAAGMKYIHPGYNPVQGWADMVIAAMADPSNQPVYLHCLHGEHRTGVSIAIYREVYEGVCYNEATEELWRWADYYFPDIPPGSKDIAFNLIESYKKC